MLTRGTVVVADAPSHVVGEGRGGGGVEHVLAVS